MDTLVFAYQRLLTEVASDLHATYAMMEFAPDSGAPIETIATPIPLSGMRDDLTWLELSVNENNAAIASLRLGFDRDASLPGLEEQRLARALVELAVLFNRTHSQQDNASQASRRILAVNEEELQRIILDIHDGPVQKLFAASSQLQMMEARLGGAPGEVRASLEQSLTRVIGLLQASLDEIKTTVGTLRPPEFRRRPLVSVLQSLIIQHESLTGMGVEFHVEGDIPHVSLSVKIALYRILQEGLSNAYRHAKVDHLDVRLVGKDGAVTLEIVDQGPGFTPPPLEGPSATEREEHIGLRGMRDRAQLVGGQFRLASRPGEGTRIQVKVYGEV